MKKYQIFALVFMVIVSLFLGVQYSVPTMVYAEEAVEDPELTPEPEPTPEEEIVEEKIFDDLMRGGYEISVRSELEDPHLYSALLQIIKDHIKETYSYNFKGTTLYSTMFKNFTEIIIPEMSIATLNGLEKFKFNELETLKITNNELTDVKKDLFVNMPKLKTLDLGCNKITSIDLSTAVNLEKINLSSNNLTEINLENIESKNINVNLASNNFEDITKIVLPTRIDSINLNLLSNNIIDIPQEYFEYEKLHMNLGVQGLKSDSATITDTQSSIKFFKVNNIKNFDDTMIEGVELVIYKIETLEDKKVATFKDSDITEGNYLNLNSFGVGDYYFEYVKDNTPLYQKGDSEFDYFKTYKFNVLPAKCTFKFEHNGKVLDNFDKKVTGKVKVTIYAEENAEIYYSVNGSEWQKGNEVMCDQGGNYTISAKCVLSGIESHTKTVVVRTSLNTVISDGLMLVLLLIFTLALFMVVVPYVSKKFFRN